MEMPKVLCALSNCSCFQVGEGRTGTRSALPPKRPHLICAEAILRVRPESSAWYIADLHDLAPYDSLPLP